MLQSLSIRDVVLIERLDLSFDAGLTVLTGETGAGKSILLDSLGLALGARAESGLVRHGAEQAGVTAAFDLPSTHAAFALLAEQGIAADGELVVRRVLNADGRSRAFVNDQPVSVGLLRQLGDTLVEIHGQFESHSLLNPAIHRGVLDAFGGLEERLKKVSTAYRTWREATKARTEAERMLRQAREEEEILRHAISEISTIAPKPGEEVELADKRSRLMHAEKLVEGMNAALAALERNGAVETNLRQAQKALERVADKAGGQLNGAIGALERATMEAAEALAQLEKASTEIDLDPRHLEQTEERLFALRDLARKHGVEVAGLVKLGKDLQKRLDAVMDGEEGLARLARAESAAREAYLVAARDLSRARQASAKALDAAVAAELPPLKLDKAKFVTRIEELEESGWGENGLDGISFLVATNPGTPPGPLAKIASGGELARFMLALKVVLAGTSTVATLVFDEVDSGIGGAVAAAVGDRLARLAGKLQVLVVTHSPQVAARGGKHLHVAKSVRQDKTLTEVSPLHAEARQEEIARMLSGAAVTDEARAAALKLLSA
jgi:DNA repair protein RecN (Recombination protein N)